MIDTTERVCPECNGNLKHIVSRLDETEFTVPNLKDWSRIYIKGSSGVVMELWIERSKI